MRFVHAFAAAALLALGALAFPVTVRAGTAEVREVARMNNCAPKKIEIYQQALGLDGHTVYRVDCNMPKAVGPAGDTKPADALLIDCDATLCQMLRPMSAEKK